MGRHGVREIRQGSCEIALRVQGLRYGMIAEHSARPVNAVWYWPAFPAYCPSMWMTGPFKVNAAGEGLFSTLRPIIWRDAPQDGVSMSWSSLSNSGSVESRASGSLSGWWSCLYMRDFKRKLCHRGCTNARKPATKWIFSGLLYVVDRIQDETIFWRWRAVV